MVGAACAAVSIRFSLLDWMASSIAGFDGFDLNGIGALVLLAPWA